MLRRTGPSGAVRRAGAGMLLAAGIAIAAAGDGQAAVIEYVVPGTPVIQMLDGRQVAGHIVGMDQSSVLILTETGTSESILRAAIGEIRFTTIAGQEIAGDLVGWQSGVYELSGDEAVIKVYNVAPVPRTPLTKSAAAGEQGLEVAGSVEGVAVATTGSVPAEAPAAEPPPTAVQATGRAGQKGEVAIAAARTGLRIEATAAPVRESEGMVHFDLELSAPADSSIVLIYATIDGSAVAGEDYEAQRGVLILKKGQTGGRIEAPVLDDDVAEGEETLVLFLTVDPTVATITNRQILGTIQDDD
jgi:hypothetical protein